MCQEETQRHERLAIGESATIYMFIKDGFKMEENENLTKSNTEHADYAECSDLNYDENNDSHYVSQTHEELTSTICATSSEKPRSPTDCKPNTRH